MVTFLFCISFVTVFSGLLRGSVSAEPRFYYMLLYHVYLIFSTILEKVGRRCRKEVAKTMKNKIILVAGYPAAGKSTFSTALSKHLKIPCFNKDIIREVMAYGFGIENEEFLNRDKKGSLTTFKLMLHTAERLLQAGVPCILESNFQVINPQQISEHEQIKNLLAKHNCECLTFVFKGELDIISERYYNRDDERHWIHGKAVDKDAIKHYCIATRLGEFEIGQTVTVDTTSFAEVNYDDLFAIAEKFIES